MSHNEAYIILQNVRNNNPARVLEAAKALAERSRHVVEENAMYRAALVN